MGGGNSQWGRAGLQEEVRTSEQVLGLGMEAKVGTAPVAPPLPLPLPQGPGLWGLRGFEWSGLSSQRSKGEEKSPVGVLSQLHRHSGNSTALGVRTLPLCGPQESLL